MICLGLHKKRENEGQHEERAQARRGKERGVQERKTRKMGGERDYWDKEMREKVR